VKSRSFLKMSGGGNDFVVFDNRSRWFPGGGEPVVRLCRRGAGVGADAVLLLEEDPKADLRMVYYNADGSEAPMCGNGAMCVARYARMIGVASQPVVHVATGSGTLEARVDDPAKPTVRLQLPEPTGLVTGYPELEGSTYAHVGFVDTSTPHVVAMVDEVAIHDIRGEGKRLRFDPRWQPLGTNVDFVTILDRHHIRMRTFERGVEAETLSCGTGAVASAILCSLWGSAEPPIRVETSGGFPLEVDFDMTDGEGGRAAFTPHLTGHTRIVYSGVLDEI
jgi:diaminopimelate epimerase